ncbi:hypothetical protein JCM10908_002883 [Rhodotorula pacifica]|uniref:uncharacterized protein n=1 Tax=Rhodotorula pacifica TaxID=1495444 RepID=UPI00316E0402
MSACPQLAARFSTCDDLLAAIRSASFPREGSDKPIRAEYTSRKTAGGKRFTVRCKIGIKKPGRKKVGERSREEEPRCLFRIVASRETISATPRSYAFVVTEYDPHTGSAHEHDYFITAGDASELGPDTPKPFGPRRNAAGRFLPSTSKASPAAQQQPPPSPSSPAFVPDSPVILDSKLVLSSGFAIPLLPIARDSGEGGGGRNRPTKRPLAKCEHRGDTMWRAWEQHVRVGDAEKAAKRPRLRGTGGEDALRAWGWVSNLAQDSEPPEEEETSARGEYDLETDVMAETSRANAAPVVHKAQDAATHMVTRGETGSGQIDGVEPQHQHFLAFWTRPTVISVEPVPVPVPWSKIMPMPIMPFTPPPAAAAIAVQDGLPASPTPTESASMSSFALESRHETPETSFSPVSPTLYRPTAPIGRSTAGQPNRHSQHDTSTLDNFAPADSKHRQEQDLEREQMALEALLGLQQLTFQLHAELAQSEPASTSPQIEPRPAAEVFGDDTTVEIEEHPKASSARKPPAVSMMPPRKLSRWERPEPAEHAPESSEHEPKSAADDAAVTEAKVPSSDVHPSEEAPAASPPEPVPAALAFVPRAHKKPLTGRRVPSTPLRTTSSGASTSGPSMAFSSSHKAMMAVAQASKIKREADLREELRSASVAPSSVGGEMDGERVAEAKAKQAREQAEALKHMLWKLGGEHEGNKIDRLYSAVGLRDKLLQLERTAPAFRTPEALSKPNAEVYISLLAGYKRPARHRLPSLPTFPHRPPASSPLSSRGGSGSSIVSSFESNLQPDKRLLLALEYLYGRAVGPDECAYLATTEPAMWELVKVAAAVAEVNEWIRRMSRGRQSREGESTRSWRMSEEGGGGSRDSVRRQGERH